MPSIRNTIIASILALTASGVVAFGDDHELALLIAKRDVLDAQEAYLAARSVYDSIKLDAMQVRDLGYDHKLQRRAKTFPCQVECSFHGKWTQEKPRQLCPACRQEKASKRTATLLLNQDGRIREAREKQADAKKEKLAREASNWKPKGVGMAEPFTPAIHGFVPSPAEKAAEEAADKQAKQTKKAMSLSKIMNTG